MASAISFPPKFIRLVLFDMDQTLLSVHTGGWFRGNINELATKVVPAFLDIVPELLVNRFHVGVVTFSDELMAKPAAAGKAPIGFAGPALVAKVLELAFEQYFRTNATALARASVLFDPSFSSTSPAPSPTNATKAAASSAPTPAAANTNTSVDTKSTSASSNTDTISTTTNNSNNTSNNTSTNQQSHNNNNSNTNNTSSEGKAKEQQADPHALALRIVELIRIAAAYPPLRNAILSQEMKQRLQPQDPNASSSSSTPSSSQSTLITTGMANNKSWHINRVREVIKTNFSLNIDHSGIMLFDDSDENVLEAQDDGVHAFRVDKNVGFTLSDWDRALRYLAAIGQ